MSALKIIIEMKLVCVRSKTNLPGEIHVLTFFKMNVKNCKILRQASSGAAVKRTLLSLHRDTTGKLTHQVSIYSQFSSIT